jgi:hypothetical protein
MERSAKLPRVLTTSVRYASFPGGVANLRNLGVGGATLEDRDPLSIGNRIPLILHLGNETVSCVGIVTRSIPAEEMAVEFVDISAADRERLFEFIKTDAAARNRARLNVGLSNAGRAPAIAPSASVSTPAAQPLAPLPRLAELLLQRGAVTADQLAAAAAEYRQRGGRFCALLLRLGIVSDQDLAACFNEEYRIPLIDVTTASPTTEALQLVPCEVAKRHEILPIGVAGSTLTVATSDPSNLEGRDEAKFHSGRDLRVTVAPSRALRKAIQYFYQERVREAG